MSQKGKSRSNANTGLRCAYTVITRCFNHLSRFIINFMARCPCPTSDYYETAFFNPNYSYYFHKLYLRGIFCLGRWRGFTWFCGFCIQD